MTAAIVVTGNDMDTRVPGSYTVVYSAGNSSATQRSVMVVDTTAPQFDFNLALTEIWPPNRRMFQAASLPGISDNAVGEVNVVITVTSTQGDRSYVITSVATDEAGNELANQAEVIVPHSQSGNAEKKSDKSKKSEKKSNKNKKSYKNKKSDKKKSKKGKKSGKGKK